MLNPTPGRRPFSGPELRDAVMRATDPDGANPESIVRIGTCRGGRVPRRGIAPRPLSPGLVVACGGRRVAAQCLSGVPSGMPRGMCGVDCTQASHQAPVSLRETRVAARLSQAGLAVSAALVVNHATVSRWESGLRRPPHDLVEPMAVVLGVPVKGVWVWFTPVRWLKGDGIGRLPGLKHLLQNRGVGIEVAVGACGMSVEQMGAWLFGVRTLQRAAVEPLARLLQMSQQEFVHAARHAAGRDTHGGSVLRGARLARRLTQDELGRRVGVAGETVSHWERSTWIPPVHQVFRLARVLGIDAGELGGGPGVSMPDPGQSSPHADAGVGGRLRDARLRAGRTRAQLTWCIGVHSSTVGGWEAGRSRPQRMYRQRLDSVLAFEAEWNRRYGDKEVAIRAELGLSPARYSAILEDLFDLPEAVTIAPATMSIGVTLLRAGESTDALVARADQAMYEAKQGGRNRVISIA